MNNQKRILDFFALTPIMFGLLAMVIFIGLGEKMAERFLPIYLIALGGGSIIIGLLNGLDNLLSALYSLLGGFLSDRIGAKRSLLIFNLLSLAGFLIVALIPSWIAVIAGAILFLSWTAISLPATMSLIASSFPKEKRTMATTMHSMVRRIPMALGPVIGGILIGHFGERGGVRLAFGISALLAVAAIAIQQRLIKETHSDSKKKSISPLKVWSSMRKELKILLASDILVRFCEQIPYAFVVVWAMKSIAEPITALQFGLLTAIEMVTAMLIYIPIGYLADKGKKKPFVVITFFNFTLFPLILLYSLSLECLVVAFIVRGLKEFGEPTRKSLILDFSRKEYSASTFGLYYLIRDVIVSIAAFGGAFLWEISPSVNFVTAISFGLAGTLLYLLKGSDSFRKATENN